MSADPVVRSLPDPPNRRLGGAPPAAAAKVLGTYLRRQREANGLTIREIAPAIRASISKISRMERGECTPAAEDVWSLVRIYGVQNSEEITDIEELLRHISAAPWAGEYSDITPGWFRRLIGLERAAARIQIWEGVVVPGLLQTREYAEAIIRAGRYKKASNQLQDVQRLVEQRMERQRILRSEKPPALLVLLDESVLYRRIGGAEVLIGQLHRLRDAQLSDDQVNVRILPVESGVTPPRTAFTYLSFDPAGPAEVVYVEQIQNGASYVSKDSEVELYRYLLDRLKMQVADRRTSLDLIDKAIGWAGDEQSSGWRWSPIS
ncbi:helix-turn-helix domain-containing protein [Kitasatospora sp. NPDC051984]|uniref:helix-turn-helix domain-containing protein n=1 Tax=Kitasatospora sp. NPDC051984 TaxID=3364059 RepID=UPI0037C89D2A